MQLLRIGQPGRQLFTALHDSEQAARKQTAVLIINTFGHEGLRAQRMLRVLAELLARRGYTALRFDYFGDGDSDGGSEDGSPDAWRDNVLLSHSHLAHQSQAKQIIWIALGLGAAIAAEAAARATPTVAHRIYWEPWWRPAEYLDEIVRKYRQYRGRLLRAPRHSAAAQAEAFGYPLTTALTGYARSFRAESLLAQTGSRLTFVQHQTPAELSAELGISIPQHTEWLHCPHWVTSAGNEIDASAIIPRRPIDLIAKAVESWP